MLLAYTIISTAFALLPELAAIVVGLGVVRHLHSTAGVVMALAGLIGVTSLVLLPVAEFVAAALWTMGPASTGAPIDETWLVVGLFAGKGAMIALRGTSQVLALAALLWSLRRAALERIALEGPWSSSS